MSRLGRPVGVLGSRVARCLGEDLTAYADRAMDAATLLRWDRHVVVCVCCRSAVEAERRVLASLRSPSTAGVSSDLRGMLLAMAAPSQAATTGSFGPPAVPTVPAAPVRVVDRGAPAMHRSARRSTVVAGLAAGATAAAAWSLVMTGGSLSPPTPQVSPPVQRARPTGPAFVTASFVVPNLGGARVAPVPTTGSGPTVGAQRPRWAQSTP